MSWGQTKTSYTKVIRVKTLQVLMVLAALSLAVPGWALAQGADEAPVPTHTVILPQGTEMSEDEAGEITGALGPVGIVVVRVVGGAVTGAVSTAVGELILTGSTSWRTAAAGAVGGAITGAASAWYKIMGW